MRTPDCMGRLPKLSEEFSITDFCGLARRNFHYTKHQSRSLVFLAYCVTSICGFDQSVCGCFNSGQSARVTRRSMTPQLVRYLTKPGYSIHRYSTCSPTCTIADYSIAIRTRFHPPCSTSNMTSEAGTTTLTIHCLCKAHVFTTEVARSELPLPAYACHCDSCRHVTGALYSLGLYWPEPAANVDTSRLKSNAFSETFAALFCGTCSTPMFFKHVHDTNAQLGIFTGTLKNDEGNLIKFAYHIFVGDTKDGGATVWLRKPNADGTEVKRYKDSSQGETKQETAFEWPITSSLTGYEKKLEDAIPIRCKCKGVDFVLHRGNYDNKQKEELPWSIDPKTHKLLAIFCACDSCRLFSGNDISYWCYTELKHISFSEAEGTKGQSFPRDSKELKAMVDARDPAMGTLAYHASSPDVQRYFCSSCAACIFYASDDRPEIVDVAIGVLEASDGARAEGFLSWSFGEVENIDDTKGGWREPLMKRVEEESERWREERAYPKCWRRVQREEAEAKNAIVN